MGVRSGSSAEVKLWLLIMLVGSFEPLESDSANLRKHPWLCGAGEGPHVELFTAREPDGKFNLRRKTSTWQGSFLEGFDSHQADCGQELRTRNRCIFNLFSQSLTPSWTFLSSRQIQLGKAITLTCPHAGQGVNFTPELVDSIEGIPEPFQPEKSQYSGLSCMLTRQHSGVCMSESCEPSWEPGWRQRFCYLLSNEHTNSTMLGMSPWS